MKTNTILLIGGFFVLCWYLGRKINSDKTPVIPVNDAGKTGAVPGASELPAQPMVANVNNATGSDLFPSNVFQRFAVNQGGESTRTYEVSDKV
jgi:hypothetical protein